MTTQSSLSGLRWLALLGLLAAVTGCSSDQRELQAYIDQVKARPGGAIEPLPEIRPAPSYVYEAGDRRSPFLPDQPQQILTANPNAVGAPDLNRPREYLENEPLDALAMVGTMSNTNSRWGLVQDRSGKVHQVMIGNYMGHNFGRVVNITPSEIELVEIVPDSLGGFMERPASIGLSD